MMLAHCTLNGKSGHEAGRELLQNLYREATGDDLPEIRVTDRGKPCFPEGAWHFSISHTKHHAFCALSRNPIGIDAEETDRKIRLDLAKKILSPEEKIRFNEADDQSAALLKFWVLKEAAAKLSGEGLRGYPNHTNFSPEDPRIREIYGCYLAILEEKEE